MTEPAARPRREPIRKPGPLLVIASSLGLFLAITALLALQLRSGADPALGKGEPQLVAAVSAPRKVVIRRRVIVTRIVEHRERAPRGGTAGTARGSAQPGAAGSGPAAAPPSAAASGPGTAAPAPSAAAPAAAAPRSAAPLTTRSS